MGKAKQDVQSTLLRKASRKEGVWQSGERLCSLCGLCPLLAVCF